MRLVVDNLAQMRGDRQVFAGLSFTLAAGEALILRGANGAGKTTLLRTLAGFLPPAAGSLRLDGIAAGADIGEHAQVVGHANGIKGRLTVAENIAFWCAYLGSGAAGDVRRALAAFDLQDLADVPAAYLSAGQRRRVGLARLVAVHRPLWLLDEPTTSLDQEQIVRFVDIMRAHLASGGLIVAATHVPLDLAAATVLDLSALRRARAASMTASPNAVDGGSMAPELRPVDQQPE